MSDSLQTVAHQGPLSAGFSRQEYWSGLPCPPPGDLPDPGNKLTSHASPELQVDFFTADPLGEPYMTLQIRKLIFILELDN